MGVSVDNFFYATPGTVPSWAIPVPTVNDHTVTVAGDPGFPNRRGIVIFMHPSQSSDQKLPLVVPSMSNGINQAFQELATTGSPNLQSSGWVSVLPEQPVGFSIQGVGYTQSMSNVILNDNTATAHGWVLVQVYRAWFRKLKLYLQRKYQVANPPIILFGYSLGAWVTAELAANEQSSIIGYACHCLPTLWENLFGPLSGQNCSGADLNTTFLSGVTIPGTIGHSESSPGVFSDQVVGWTSSTTPASNGSLIQASAGNVTAYVPTQSAPDHLFFTADAAHYASWIVSTFNGTYGGYF